MSSAGGCPSWQKMVSVGTSIVPPGPCPPPADTRDASSAVTTPQVTASLHDFAVSLTPARKPQDRELYMREHDYNSQVSSLRVPVERAVASLKTGRILFIDYRRPLKTFVSSFRAAIGLYFFKETFA